MIKHVGTNFETHPGTRIELEGGAWAEAQILSSGEFNGLNEVAYYRMSKGFQFKPHRHVGWLVITVLTGRLKVETRGHETEIFGPGDTYLVEPKHLHVETSLEDNTVVLVTQNIQDPYNYPMQTVEV